jgi:hypothetical protein
MPIQDITIKEYECAHCGYKWTNYANGVQGPTPKNCAKCKRRNWNDPTTEITPGEVGLRRKIKGLPETTYRYFMDQHWPDDISETFLSLKPGPTIKELEQVVYPFGRNHKGWIPCPDRPGWYMKDPDLRKKTYDKRIQNMVEIIKSRGIDYNPTEGIKRTKERYDIYWEQHKNDTFEDIFKHAKASMQKSGIK